MPESIDPPRAQKASRSELAPFALSPGLNEAGLDTTTSIQTATFGLRCRHITASSSARFFAG